MRKKQRGFKTEGKRFFSKNDIFISRMASILKMPHQKVKILFYEKTFFCVMLNDFKKENLDKRGIKIKEVEWLENTYLVKNKSDKTLKNIPEYKQNAFYVQNLCEILPTVSLNIQDEDFVLFSELSSRTRHVFAMLKNEENITTIREENTYDKILLNAPSTREGEIFLGKPRALKSWNIKKGQMLSTKQKELILEAFECLKSGGLLAYFTTTLSPNENEEVVSFLLEKKANASLVDIEVVNSEKFTPYKSFVRKGLREWNGKTNHKDIHKSIRIVPGKTMFGGYLALIKKS